MVGTGQWVGQSDEVVQWTSLWRKVMLMRWRNEDVNMVPIHRSIFM